MDAPSFGSRHVPGTWVLLLRESRPFTEDSLAFRTDFFMQSSGLEQIDALGIPWSFPLV